MIDWLRLFGRRQPVPLTGAPPVRRTKTYSAQSGYVYQYVFAGRHEAEYVFEVTADRKTHFPAVVLIEDAVLDQWQRDRSRELTLVERYAVAKIALAQAFDERAGPDQMRAPIRVRRADLDLIAETLGLL
ncbi:MAG: hypothetical protein ACM336_19540 [Acidobacteriota bacterium]